ncbi:MAG: Smr/MutS family protein [Deltaproteobacteria bacterium]|jgi:DNA mismatch repair protein MutS2|nr:Smr/MutS family protein [Deltaproteobacteria bacterium]
MNLSALEILDYDSVLKILAEEAHSEPGALAGQSLTPDLTAPEILNSWAKIKEARAILDETQSPSFHELVDLTPLIKELAPERALLEPTDLLIISQVAAVSRRTLEYFKPYPESAPLLSTLAGELNPFSPLVEDLEKSIGPEGEILDSASPLLFSLRQEQSQARSSLTLKLTELMRSEEFKPLIRDEIVTTRGGRFVVPVRAGAAGRSRGMVHDWSKSGATAYLEPMETVEDNNRLAYLRNREKEEIRRILESLSARCRAHSEDLLLAVSSLTKLDLIMAQARLARDWRAVTPEYCPGEGFDLRELRHPILEKRLRDQGRNMVPLDLTVSPASPMLVISGLNTGGKTVALKTLGLNLALACSGLPIPAQNGSRLDFPEDILAIMGDGQDLTADLSTFSGHVRAIGQVLKEARPGVVILLDEIGGGTDPAEGAALGLAVLEKLRLSGALCLAATHFHLLKSWAALTDGVIPVAVKSSRDGRPVYGLAYGSPGFSGGLAMARRLGLPEELVARAENYLEDGQKEAIALLQRLEDERAALFEERTELARVRRSLAVTESETRAKLTKETEALKRKSIEQDKDIKSALARHRRELADLKEQIQKELKEGLRPDPAAVNLKAAESAQRLADVRPVLIEEKPAMPIEDVKPGDSVLVLKLGCSGTVKSVNPEKNEALIEAGGLSIKACLSELYPPKEKSHVPRTRVTFTVAQDDEKGLSLNLLGQTVAEATVVIDREIDRALIRGQSRLTIIHGLGTGRLRRGIAEHLKTHPKVREFFHPNDVPGGQGITTVELD